MNDKTAHKCCSKYKHIKNNWKRREIAVRITVIPAASTEIKQIIIFRNKHGWSCSTKHNITMSEMFPDPWYYILHPKNVFANNIFAFYVKTIFCVKRK